MLIPHVITLTPTFSEDFKSKILFSLRSGISYLWMNVIQKNKIKLTMHILCGVLQFEYVEKVRSQQRRKKLPYNRKSIPPEVRTSGNSYLRKSVLLEIRISEKPHLRIRTCGSPRPWESGKPKIRTSRNPVITEDQG